MIDLLEKVPPYSVEAEKAVLGSMMIEKEALDRGLELLNEKSFYSETHQKIFSVIRDLALNSQIVDPVTLATEMKRQQIFDLVGGGEYIVELTNSVATAAHIDHYAEIVHKKSILRDLIQAATRVVSECYQENEDAGALVDRAEGLIFSVAEKKNRKGLIPISSILHQVIENLETLHKEKKPVTGVPTGFRDFDKLTAGLQRGNLVIVAARPGMGKTAFALNVAIHVAVKEKLPVAIFSLEMSRYEIGMRLLSAVTGIPLHKLKTGFFDKSDWPTITRKAEVLSGSQLHLDDSSAMTVLGLRSAARRLSTHLRAQGTPLALLIVDYLQLMRGSGRTPESRQVEIAEISRSLKGLARDLDVPILALSQLNRSPEERGREGRPQLSHLRESGALEQDADLVGFIFREAMYKTADELRDNQALARKAKLIIAKQRNGPQGEIDLIFMQECARFEDFSAEPD